MLACYVINTSSEDVSGAKKCLPQLEDYEECLHHRKEVCVFGSTIPHAPLTHLRAHSYYGHAWCSKHIEERKRRIRGKTCRRLGRYGIWGCWGKRRIRRLCWRG